MGKQCCQRTEIIKKASRETFMKTIKDENKKYLSEKISSSNTSKELFNVFNDFIGKKKTMSLPNNIPINELPDTFNKFFIDMIDVIRN